MKTVVVQVKRFVRQSTYRLFPHAAEAEECVGFQQTWTNEFCN